MQVPPSLSLLSAKPVAVNDRQPLADLISWTRPDSWNNLLMRATSGSGVNVTVRYVVHARSTGGSRHRLRSSESEEGRSPSMRSSDPV